ncbi:hypothetical protein AWZ03_009372 [Drosophila navojoa]|uniref:Uncharacterized protein n=1 Tax=Drosophila navojoa TaxID=7232 RepID=A0A484B680_DRONA|nr:hypothetical protein AWZ03_009372 [Drosophila navojoa]
MCKFTNRLFVLALLQCVALALPKPLKSRSSATDLIDLLYNDYGDYGYQVEEVHYDQRQKGSENLRWHLDGFVFGLPVREDYSWMEQLFETYSNSPLAAIREPVDTYPTESIGNKTDQTTAQVVNISTPKKDIESRHSPNSKLSSAPRTKSEMVQLLKLFRRPQA